MRIVDKDHGARAMQRRLHAARGMLISVGMVGERAARVHPNAAEGETVGELAMQHELGLGVPRRSWLAAWVDGNRKRIDEDLADLAISIAEGEGTPRELAQAQAQAWADAMRQRVLEGGVTPPISPSTAKKKGHDTPLVETHAIASAITGVVRSG